MGRDAILSAGALSGALLAVAGLLVLGWRGVRLVFRTWRRLQDFLDDWTGEVARPGVPARAGVMWRLETIEDRLSIVEREVRPGGSLREQLGRVEQAVDGTGEP